MLLSLMKHEAKFTHTQKIGHSLSNFDSKWKQLSCLSEPRAYLSISLTMLDFCRRIALALVQVPSSSNCDEAPHALPQLFDQLLCVASNFIGLIGPSINLKADV